MDAYETTTDNDGSIGTQALQSALDCAEVFLSERSGPDREQMPFQLYALAVELTRTQLKPGSSRIELKAQKLIDDGAERHYWSPKAGEEASRWIRTCWSKLEKKITESEDHLFEVARRQGYGFIARPAKETSTGGPNRPSRYFLIPKPVPAVSGPVPLRPLPSGCVQYHAEQRQGTVLGYLLSLGVPLRPIRRYLVSALLLITAFMWLAVVVNSLWLFLTGESLMMIGTVLKAGLFGSLLLYVLFWPLLGALTWRVISVPIWLTPWSEDEPLLLEALVPDAETDGPAATKSVQFVKYSGVCPICNGRVLIHGSLWQFPGRLVGRCKHSPREHVFSFDHVTRIGYPLYGGYAQTQQTTAPPPDCRT